MLDKRIKFDERYDSQEYGTTTLYFIAPKEMLKKFMPTNDYPEAISMEISIEFPLNVAVVEHAYVSISPTNADGEDYDWYDVDIPYDGIEELIKLAEK